MATKSTRIVSQCRFQENWNEYRAVADAESLKQEKYLFLARAEPYNGDQPLGVMGTVMILRNS